MTGRGRRHVRSKRESLGIEPFQKQFNSGWTKKMLSRLGKASDAQIATELNIDISTVSLQRAKLKIPPYQPKK